MRFEQLQIHNVGPFTDVNLNFQDAPGVLVAVQGDNGAGKSTLLELLAGALYRQCPTRGSLTELATARDARVHVRAVNGAPYEITQLADNISKRSETLITKDGTPVVETGKVRDADAWVAKHFPSPEVLYTSSFAPQGSGGFLAMSAAERKRVLLRVLQIEKYEALAEQAREKARLARSRYLMACEREQNAAAQYPDVAASEHALQNAKIELEVATANLEQARVELDAAKAELAAYEAQREVLARKNALHTKILELRQDEEDLSEKIKNNRMLLERKHEIEAATKRAEDKRTQLEKQAEKLSELQVAFTRSQIQAGNMSKKAQDAQHAYDRLVARVERLRERAQALKGVGRAVKALQRANEEWREAEAVVTQIEHEVHELNEAMHNVSADRCDKLRGGLGRILGGERAPKKIASDTLEADDALIELDESGPRQLKELEKRLAAAKKARDKAHTFFRACEREAARRDEAVDVSKELAQGEADLERLAAEAQAAARAAKDISKTHSATQAELARLSRAQRELDASRQEDAKLLALAPKLEQAEARLEELEPRVRRVRADIGKTLEEIQRLPPTKPAPMADVQRYADAVKRAERAQLDANAGVTRAQIDLDRAQQGAEVRATLKRETEQCELEMADWKRLGDDLGKDGIQALEIDCAIPALNELTNDLLHTCHGSRFTVEIRTDRLSADGKRTLEDLDVRVIDTVQGRDASGETYSGGERVIVGEAVSLALTMLACQRAGLSRPTLVRDESGAALDAKNGRAYVAMLRRAAELIDAHKVLFVSHNKELQELADATISVGNGTAVLQ